jgi:GNAT superfamily N-acetyltransferase
MVDRPLSLQVKHLHMVPWHTTAVAQLIHNQFWADKPGATAAGMQARLETAEHADRLPLALVALHGGQPLGVVNLVDDDDQDRPDCKPWLAGLVVHRAWRGRGVGSVLVRELLAHARRLGLPHVYLGTDAPGFYTRLGAVEHEHVRDDFCFMRFDL